MQLDELIEKLRSPAAYPHEVDGEIVVHQTHISVVFLAGDYAYKFKKPVDLGFIDYSTLAKRRHFCEREVELNRRLAPDVYLGVVPLCRSGSALEIDGEGDPVEWAVKMVRLAEEDTLEHRLAAGEVDAATMRRLAAHIASFHQQARAGEDIARYGRLDVVAGNARENFEQTAEHVGRTVHRDVYERARRLTEDELERRAELIERRADEGVPRDTHGDLRLDHVYFDDGEFTIVDCIEFNDRFRYADPVADMAFLVMDLEFVGRRELAAEFADAYFAAYDDAQGRQLLAHYVAYRAVVRAKVEGIRATDTEAGDRARSQAMRKARAHWLLALGRLETTECRPAMVLIGGLPGTGKSTVAGELAERANFEVIDTDVVRKELAGLDPDEPARADYGEGIYTSEWSEKTYAECLRRAEELLFEGGRVIIDATFNSDERRQMFLESARRCGVPGLFVALETREETARERLDARQGGASDADWETYMAMREAWQAGSGNVDRYTVPVSAEGEVDEVVGRVSEVVAERRLAACGARRPSSP
ncbi:MAG: AAA family ATPase [Persicimonas sp.]